MELTILNTGTQTDRFLHTSKRNFLFPNHTPNKEYSKLVQETHLYIYMTFTRILPNPGGMTFFFFFFFVWQRFLIFGMNKLHSTNLNRKSTMRRIFD